MTKSELITKYAKHSGCTRKEAEATVNYIFETICETLGTGEKVVLTGFGTFEVRERNEKTCLNPRTGEPIRLPAGRAAAFKPGRGMKAAVTGKKD